MQRRYDAVLLAGFGGPEGPDDVMPFLRNVTRGRGIPEDRLTEVAEHYLTLGGVSPINAQNRALREALAAELQSRGIDLPVLWGNRNWRPYLADEVAAADADGLRRLLGVATSAYSSYSSCRQYREDFATALLAADVVERVTIDKVRPYFDQAGFLAPFLDGARAAVRELLDRGHRPEQLAVVFTTHSVPTSMADASGSAELEERRPGGAYVAQHLAACQVIGDDLGVLAPGLTWQLAYQSRSGAPHIPWLEPDVNDVIAGLAAEGKRAVVVVPIGFVSDHVEVIWDLDTEAAETAASQGLDFIRVATPGTDPRFVATLADLILERLADVPTPLSPTGLPPRPSMCAARCCVNARAIKPTTAGVDSADDWAASGALDRPSGTTRTSA